MFRVCKRIRKGLTSYKRLALFDYRVGTCRETAVSPILFFMEGVGELGKVIDLKGKKFGKLNVLKRAEDRFDKKGRKLIYWFCQCDCGNVCEIEGSQLRKGITKSCGCLDHPDLSGKRFGKLTVIKVGNPQIQSNGKPQKRWLCKCDCGNKLLVCTSSLNSGHTTSCGCIKRHVLADKTRKHGKVGTRIYREYMGIKARCYNKNYPGYKNWGGRGIDVCDEWRGEHGFENFYNWSMNNGYSDNLTIDRIDNSKGYSPQNCRWTTQIVQANNTRTNVYIEYRGKIQSLSNWCRELNLEYNMIYLRYRRGWNVEKMFNQPKREW